MQDIDYTPNMDVVRSARYFIKSLCDTYGHDRGMAVWDQIRAVLGDGAAGDIFLGMLTQEYHNVSITRIDSIRSKRSSWCAKSLDAGLKKPRTL